VALILAAGASVLRASGRSFARAGADEPGPVAAAVLGFAIGLLVGLTSIGAGSLLMAVFALAYALPVPRAVGTDVVHGAILAAVASIAHLVGGRIEPLLLGSLLVGSVPGVLLGGWLCGRVPQKPVRLAVAGVLAFSGLRLL
jgi:uncharacterized membrane protein YfcA